MLAAALQQQPLGCEAEAAVSLTRCDPPRPELLLPLPPHLTGYPPRFLTRKYPLTRTRRKALHVRFLRKLNLSVHAAGDTSPLQAGSPFDPSTTRTPQTPNVNAADLTSSRHTLSQIQELCCGLKHPPLFTSSFPASCFLYGPKARLPGEETEAMAVGTPPGGVGWGRGWGGRKKKQKVLEGLSPRPLLSSFRNIWHVHMLGQAWKASTII